MNTTLEGVKIQKKGRASRSNSGATRLASSANNDMNVIKGSRSSKPPSIITRRSEDTISSYSRSPLFSNLHWAVNDMSPVNMSPRTQPLTSSPRPNTPTKRNFDILYNEKQDASAVEGSYSRSVRARTVSDAPILYSHNTANEDHQVSNSLPSNHPLVYSHSNFEKILSPQEQYQFPLFGQDVDSSAIQSFLSDEDMEDGIQHTNINRHHVPVPNNSQLHMQQRPVMDLSPEFNLQEFRMNSSSDPLSLSEPGLFDFDNL